MARPGKYSVPCQVEVFLLNLLNRSSGIRNGGEVLTNLDPASQQDGPSPRRMCRQTQRPAEYFRAE